VGLTQIDENWSKTEEARDVVNTLEIEGITVPEVLDRTAPVLAQIGNWKAIDILQENAIHRLNRESALALMRVGDIPRVLHLIDALPAMRQEAAKAIRERGTNAVQDLLSIVEKVFCIGGDYTLARSAAAMLDAIGWTPNTDSEAVQLHLVLSNPNALAKPAYLDDLIDATAHRVKEIRDVATAALSLMDSESISVVLMKWLTETWGVYHRIRDKLRTIIDRPQCIATLKAALTHDDWSVRLRAAEVFRKSPPNQFTIEDRQAATVALFGGDWETLEQLRNASVGLLAAFLTRNSTDSEFWDNWFRILSTWTHTDRPVFATFCSRATDIPHGDVLRWEERFLESKRYGLEPATATVEAVKEFQNLAEISAVRLLTKLDCARAVEVLTRLLAERKSLFAARQLASIASVKSVAALIVALTYDVVDVRFQAALSLGVIGAPGAVDSLIAAVTDVSPMVRCAAAESLGAIGATSAVPALIVALRDTSYEVRNAAARSLGIIQDPRAVGPLVETLAERKSMSGHATSDEPLVHFGCLAVDALINAISDARVASQAAETLVRIGDLRALEPLIQVIEAGDERAKDLLAISLFWGSLTRFEGIRNEVKETGLLAAEVNGDLRTIKTLLQLARPGIEDTRRHMAIDALNKTVEHFSDLSEAELMMAAQVENFTHFIGGGSWNGDGLDSSYSVEVDATRLRDGANAEIERRRPNK
jgi:HEAT repeat protein